MVAGFGRRYSIYYPDGNVEQRTLLGPPKEVGETLKLDGTKWEVVRSSPIFGEELDFELHLEALENAPV